jgi:hypothetical protein
MARGISKNMAVNASDTQKLRTAIRRALPPILAKLYEMALAGDVQAAKLLLDRSLPALSAVNERPPISSQTMTELISEVTKRVINGEMESMEALHLVKFFEGMRELEKLAKQVEQIRGAR